MEYSWASRIIEPDELLGRFLEISSIAHVVRYRFWTVSGHTIIREDWLELVQLVDKGSAYAVLQGIVITLGTATLEQTCYFLNLTLKTDLPVVIVGAQRPPKALSSTPV